jgi:hypothetical protein
MTRSGSKEEEKSKILVPRRAAATHAVGVNLSIDVLVYILVPTPSKE